MNQLEIRSEEAGDREAIHALLLAAFDGDAEAQLVRALHTDGDVVLSLVAEREGALCGHVLFSRLHVVKDETRFPAVALAPLAVSPTRYTAHGTPTGVLPTRTRRAWRSTELPQRGRAYAMCIVRMPAAGA